MRSSAVIDGCDLYFKYFYYSKTSDNNEKNRFTTQRLHVIRIARKNRRASQTHTLSSTSARHFRVDSFLLWYLLICLTKRMKNCFESISYIRKMRSLRLGERKVTSLMIRSTACEQTASREPNLSKVLRESARWKPWKLYGYYRQRPLHWFTHLAYTKWAYAGCLLNFIRSLWYRPGTKRTSEIYCTIRTAAITTINRMFYVSIGALSPPCFYSSPGKRFYGAIKYELTAGTRLRVFDDRPL